MTATSCLSPSRRTRRLGLAVVCAGTFAFVGTSTIAVAGGPSPTSATSAASVVGLRQGDSGPTVQAVQQKLVGLGYYVAGGADGNFGPGTTAALRVFQQQNGLNPTGVVTENTARYLGLAGGVTPAGVQAPQAAAPAAAAAAPTAAAAPGSFIGLRQGSTGPAVRQLQLAILATGLYLSGGADGTFGSSTHRGVTLVQRVNGLPETGVVDAATARVLGLTGSASSPSAPAPAGTVVQVGSTGAAVQRVQQLLIKSGVTVVGGADGVFGPQTRRSVAAFQKLHGLSVTGSVDAATDAALVKAAGGGTAAPAPSSSYVGLRVGSTGPAVTKLQQAIMATGLVVRGGADGIFGQQTRTAVLVYQRVNGLPQTGIVDESTAKMLGLLTAAPAAGGGAGSGGGSAASGFASYDERGARVVALQKALLRAGISFTGGADGVFGSATAGAVMKFQRARGLRITGKLDQATAAALGLQGLPTPAQAPAVNVALQAKPLGKGPCWYGDTWQAARGSGRVHLGVDIGAPAGTPLVAVAGGRVTQVYRDRPGSLSGNGLKITAADGTYFFYAHLAGLAPGIGAGVPVRAGPGDRHDGQHG